MLRDLITSSLFDENHVLPLTKMPTSAGPHALGRSGVLMCVVAAAALLPRSTHGASVPLTMLTDSKARCMDGTLSGYYHQPASNASASKRWVFRLEGGGECATAKVRGVRLGPLAGCRPYHHASRAPTPIPSRPPARRRATAR